MTIALPTLLPGADAKPWALTNVGGDPRDPTCWSGTSFNLMNALLAQGVALEAFNSSLPPWGMTLAAALDLGRGYAYDRRRSRLMRVAHHAALSRRLSALDIDVVLHTGDLDLPLKPDGRRHYVYIDSTLDLYLKNPSQRLRRMFPGRREAERAFVDGFRQVDHFFPIADYVADNLASIYGIPDHKITVVGTGRGNISPYVGDKDFSDGHILFVAKGRVAEKGGYLLVEAMQRLRQAGVDTPLVIVGATELAKVADGIPNVDIRGRMPWEVLERLFHSALLYAMPALYEPWGLVYLEALSAKTPVMGLRRNSLPEITGNGAYGFMANAATPDAVAATIMEALRDRSKLKRMADAGQEYCLRKYSWDNVASDIIRVVRSDEQQLEAEALHSASQGG